MPIFKRTPKYGPIALAAWLIASGVLTLIPVKFPYSGEVLALVAIAAGVLILMDR